MEDNVPFLIGMEAIKKLGMIIDLKNDIMRIGTETSKLKRNGAGHIIWDDLRRKTDCEDQEYVCEVFWGQDNDEITEGDIKWIHENLAHAGTTKMMRLLKRTKRGQKHGEKSMCTTVERIQVIKQQCFVID